jgi:hypothetical protein
MSTIATPALIDFRFLKLPQELQDYIYEYYIIDVGIVFDLTIRQHRNTSVRMVTHHLAPLQTVNKPIHDAYVTRLQALR